MSDTAAAKAINAVTNGKVRELPHARSFAVESSDGANTYLVTRAVVEAADGVRVRTACTCEASRHGRSCWHVQAAELMVRRDAPAARPSRELAADFEQPSVGDLEPDRLG